MFARSARPPPIAIPADLERLNARPGPNWSRPRPGNTIRKIGQRFPQLHNPRRGNPQNLSGIPKADQIHRPRMFGHGDVLFRRPNDQLRWLHGQQSPSVPQCCVSRLTQRGRLHLEDRTHPPSALIKNHIRLQRFDNTSLQKRCRAECLDSPPRHLAGPDPFAAAQVTHIITHRGRQSRHSDHHVDKDGPTSHTQAIQRTAATPARLTPQPADALSRIGSDGRQTWGSPWLAARRS